MRALRERKTIFYALLLFAGVGFLWYTAPSHNTYSDVAFRELIKDEGRLLPYVQKFGARATLLRMEKLSAGGSAFDCHQEAHNVGRAAYEVEGEKAFAVCDSSCHSGCYHGAMELYLRTNGTVNFAARIGRICDSFESNFGIFECLHGVGHGVMVYMDYNLPDAIKECQKLDTEFAVRSCYGGMFMENILTGQGLGAAADLHETEWVSDDPHFPCNDIGEESSLLYECYQMQTSWMLYINEYDFDIVAKECEHAPKSMVPVCFKSFGRDAAGHTLRDPARILSLCEKVPRAHYRECIVGALNVIVDFWGPKLKNQAAEFCALTPTIGKDVCWNTLAARLPNVFTNSATQKARCAEFEDAYRHLCIQ